MHGPTVFVKAIFCIVDTLTCPPQKVKCFSAPYKHFLFITNLPVDKPVFLCLNYTIITEHRMTLKENPPFRDAAENRWLVQTGAEGKGIGLVPESVL